jgi:hypothetical protein
MRAAVFLGIVAVVGVDAVSIRYAPPQQGDY